MDLGVLLDQVAQDLVAFCGRQGAKVLGHGHIAGGVEQVLQGRAHAQGTAVLGHADAASTSLARFLQQRAERAVALVVRLAGERQAGPFAKRAVADVDAAVGHELPHGRGAHAGGVTVLAGRARVQADLVAVLVEGAVLARGRDGQQLVADHQPVLAAVVHQPTALAHVLVCVAHTDSSLNRWDERTE